MNSAIFLIGFMGAGKTTAARMLAAETGYSFIDLDAAVEIVAGKSIPEIFAENGEGAFRKLESTVLQQLKNKENIIVATGGGCGASAANLSFMKENGIAVFLRAQAGVLFHRLMPEKNNRPLISRFTDVGLMEYILDILPAREAVYQNADLIVNAENSPASVVKEILAFVNHQSFSGLEARTS